MAVVSLLYLLASMTVSPQQAASIVRLEPGVAGANLQTRVTPEYPALARAARVQATVVIQLTVSKDGRVSASSVVRGHPMLNQAVLGAVQQWRYKPHEVNGEPVEVETTVTVDFRLRSAPTIPSGMASISGRVLRADGTPAKGVVVDVTLPGQPPLSSAPPPSFTEVAGEYRLEVPAQPLLRPGSPTDDLGEFRIERLGRGTYTVFARLNEQIYHYPGTSLEKAVLITIDSLDTNLVGIDFRIP